MEFKYRADDHRPPPSSCPFSSSMGFRSFLRAVPNNTDQMPTPNDIEERIRREVEKKEIRRQIFSGELARRKMLEEEVRRELMMEREMDLRRNLREKLSFEERVAMGLNSGHDMNISPPSYGNGLLEEPVASLSHRREFDNLLTVPELRQFLAPEIKPAPQTNKDKVIMLEEEVRRELMMEREMDLRRNLREKLSFEERVAMGLNSGHDMNISPPSYGNGLLEEPVASLSHRREFDNLLTVPELRQFLAPEIKPAPQTNKDKVIMLEEEVRRELMMEREMDLRRNLREKLSFEERVAMGLNSGHDMNISPPSYGNGLLEEPVASLSHSREFDNLLTVPKLRQFLAPEIKPAPQTNKDKVIMLPKPDPDHYEAKRKAVTPPAIYEHSTSGLNKKPKEDWSCTFCQVSVSSWKAFSEHLQGKKHKAKESALRKPKIGKSATTSSSSKKSEKSVNPTETIVITTSGLDAKADVWSLGGLNQTVAGEEILETKTDKRLLQKNHETQDSNKQNGSTEEEKAGKTKAGKRKRKFKFWCEACQVGAYSSEVMEGHRRGKKHIKRFKFCQNDVSDPSSGYQVVGKEI